MNKLVREQENIGDCKYVVTYHDGVTTCSDGSPFFDMRIFKNKRKKNQFVNGLRRSGYEVV